MGNGGNLLSRRDETVAEHGHIIVSAVLIFSTQVDFQVPCRRDNKTRAQPVSENPAKSRATSPRHREDLGRTCVSHISHSAGDSGVLQKRPSASLRILVSSPAAFSASLQRQTSNNSRDKKSFCKGPELGRRDGGNGLWTCLQHFDRKGGRDTKDRTSPKASFRFAADFRLNP